MGFLAKLLSGNKKPKKAERQLESILVDKESFEHKATPFGDFLKTPAKLDFNTIGQGGNPVGIPDAGIPEAIKQLLGSGQFGFS